MAGLVVIASMLCGATAHAQTPLRAKARYPLKISKPGSYILLENLEVKNGDAIVVTANHVSIDLNGFSILGAGADSETSGMGINAAGRSFITISHGSVAGFSGNGIMLGDDASVKGVHADSNGPLGIFCKSDCSIADSSASNNGIDGIVAGANSVITGNLANNNHKGVGITIARNSSAAGNVANLNGGGGILGVSAALPCHCRIVGNTANDNGSFGIIAGDFGVLTQNVADGNASFGICGGRSSAISGNTAGANALEGIIANKGSVVLGNSSVDNGGLGLSFPQDNTSAFGFNAMLNNHIADTSGGSSMGQGDTNLCSGQNC